MAVHQVNPQGGKLATVDPIWDRIRGEAEDIIRREPELATFIFSSVLHHDRLEHSVVYRLADRLDHSALSGDLIRQTYDEALRDDPDIGNAFRADLVAVLTAIPRPRASSIPCSTSRAFTPSRPIGWRIGCI